MTVRPTAATNAYLTLNAGDNVWVYDSQKYLQLSTEHCQWWSNLFLLFF